MIEFYPTVACESVPEHESKNAQMNLAWQFISSTDVSVFLTGKAGTGKTTFLRKLSERLPKRMVVLAPTGVAAINAGGQTIHSFFQLPFGPYIPGSDRVGGKNDRFKMSSKKKALIRSLDLLVIDEISMVRADLLDLVDFTLRQYRDREKPFGGVQLLLIGDLMQLSPVAKSEEWAMLSEHYRTPYFFSSHALQQMQYVTVELSHIYRQSDKEFIRLLGDVRTGSLIDQDVQELNQRYIPNFDPKDGDWIRLTTHNATANSYNSERLDQLKGQLYKLKAKIKGDFPEAMFPADEEIHLKIGAQVMFIKNDPSMEKAYFNGKIGIVASYDDEHQSFTVVCGNGAERIEVTPVEWENIKYNLNEKTKEIVEETVGIFTQYPLRLAWAITVHKSQGLTFDRAILDINRSFAHGQAYVALSRCRSLEGLVLTEALQPWSIKTDGVVNAFMDTELALTKERTSQLPQMRIDFAVNLLDQLFGFTPLLYSLKDLERSYQMYIHPQAEALGKSLAIAVNDLELKVIPTANKFHPVYAATLNDTEGTVKDSPIDDRIRNGCSYFHKILKEHSDRIFQQEFSISIDNQKSAENFNRAYEDAQRQMQAKLTILKGMSEQTFEVQSFLQLKATATLKAEDGKPAPPKTSKPRKEKEPKPKKEKRLPGASVEESYKLYQQGMTPAEIAIERGLAESTIWGHLGTVVQSGRLHVEDLIDPVDLAEIEDAMETMTGAYTFSDLREAIGEHIPNGAIRLVQISRR